MKVAKIFKFNLKICILYKLVGMKLYFTSKITVEKLLEHLNILFVITASNELFYFSENC